MTTVKVIRVEERLLGRDVTVERGGQLQTLFFLHTTPITAANLEAAINREDLKTRMQTAADEVVGQSFEINAAPLPPVRF